jgi:peptidoglycan hydrolase-like protein with peptidoglycan-binding domain
MLLSWTAVGCALFWAVEDSSAQQAAKKQPPPPPKAATAQKKAPVYKRSTSISRTYGKGTAQKNKRVATKYKSKAPAPRRVFYNPGQQAPSLDRYTEIERALAERGYLLKDPDGKWDQRSSEALKKFQVDQSLPADGKLSSMSLIALGLGPKRVSAAAAPAPQPQQSRPTVFPPPAEEARPQR